MTNNLTGTPGSRRWDGEWAGKDQPPQTTIFGIPIFCFLDRKPKNLDYFINTPETKQPYMQSPPLSTGYHVEVIVILSPIQTFEQRFTTLLASLPWHSAHFLYDFSQVPLFLALSQLANHVILFLNVFCSSLSYLAFRFPPCPLLDSF